MHADTSRGLAHRYSGRLHDVWCDRSSSILSHASERYGFGALAESAWQSDRCAARGKARHGRSRVVRSAGEGVPAREVAWRKQRGAGAISATRRSRRGGGGDRAAVVVGAWGWRRQADGKTWTLGRCRSEVGEWRTEGPETTKPRSRAGFHVRRAIGSDCCGTLCVRATGRD